MTDQLRLALADKCILFVDDHRITVEFYREELHHYGATTVFASNLQEGVSCLQANQAISWAVIDLHFPDMPKVLQPYANQLKTESLSLNLGQTLGLYIRDKYPHIGYCYLSVVPHIYDPTANEFGEDYKYFVLNKNDIPYNEFPQKLMDIMNRWKHEQR